MRGAPLPCAGGWKGDIVIVLAPDMKGPSYNHNSLPNRAPARCPPCCAYAQLQLCHAGQQSQIEMFEKLGVKIAWVSDLLGNLTIPPFCEHPTKPYNNWPKRKAGWKGYYYKMSMFNEKYWSKWCAVGVSLRFFFFEIKFSS